jgi:hypothetical protein
MSDREIIKVIFQKGDFHDFEYTVTSFDGDRPIDEFIALPCCNSAGDTIEYWEETYRWLGTEDDEGRLIYRHFSSKFVRSKQKGYQPPQQSENTESAEVAK